MSLEKLNTAEYSKFIHKSRYARWDEKKKRREEWDETIDRLISFWNEERPEFNEVSEEIREAITNTKVMPSMRSLMTAGKALVRDHVAGYNCFSRDTRFVTNEGIKSFSDFEDGDEIMVLGERTFKPATVVKFGKEKLYSLILTKGGQTRKEYLTTANHRWITLKPNGSDFIREEKTTIELSIGDIIKFAPKNIRNESLEPCNIALQHGMVFGDGTFNKNKGYSQITLCGDSVQFERLFITGHKTNDDKDKINIVQLPWNWKQLPDINANRSYILGFLAGWFGADGSIGKTGSSVVIHNHKKENLEFFKSLASKIGIFSSDVRENRRENPFKSGEIKPIYSMSIYGDTLPRNFFLKKDHLKRFDSIKLMNKFSWKVLSCEETDLKEDVWCIQEPENEIFTLENGIQTKNCAAVAVDNPRVFDETLFILCCGTGLGFSVERQYINQLPEIAEEFHNTDTTIVVADSKIGWASAFRQLISLLYQGMIPKWDVSRVRPAGAKLKTFGGRASGPEPLVSLFRFSINMFRNAKGRKLNSIECHDLMCKIADIVVVGGVRRCWKIGTLIDTNKGWVKIEEIDPDIHKVVFEGSEISIIKLIDNGIQDTVYINLEDGTNFTCTEDHRMYVYNHDTYTPEWRHAYELSEGNYSILKPKKKDDIVN